MRDVVGRRFESFRLVFPRKERFCVVGVGASFLARCGAEIRVRGGESSEEIVLID